MKVIQKEARPQVAEAANELDARLARLRAQRGEIIVPITIEGDAWYLKQLDFAGVMLAGILMGRDSTARIQAGELNVLRALLVTALHCGVATSATDKTAKFSLAQAEAWADEPAAIGVVSQLFAKIVEINPVLLPGNANRAATGSSSPPVKKPRKSRSN